jgi:hypothetical protein
MLEDYNVKPSTADRAVIESRNSLMAPQIEDYSEWLQAYGYSSLVVYG